MRLVLCKTCWIASAPFVLGLASCAHLHQDPPPVAAVPQFASEPIKQAGRRDSETKPASLLNDRNSEPIQLVSHDEVASALTLETALGSVGPPPVSTADEVAQTQFQPPATRVPAPGAPATQPDSRIASLAEAAGAAETELALNTIGDQGIISFGPQSGKGAPISITRNFALIVTDNNSARLQNRLIPIEYYHFFEARRVYPGLPFVPSQYAARIHPSRLSRTRVITDDDRYIFGFESILADRLSLVVRQSVVTINKPDLTLQQGFLLHKLGGIRSGWGDLQLSPKYLIFEDKKQVLSGGVGMVIPVGEKAPYHQFGNSAFIFQPYLLYLAQPTERWVVQAGLEYDIPVATNLEHVSLFRWLTFLGYRLYSGSKSDVIQTIYPLIEFHGEHMVGGFTQSTVNFTTGLRVNCFRKFQFGVGYAVPLTEQKQFSNEVIANLNYFF